MSNNVEKVPREDLEIGRRELGQGVAAIATGAIGATMVSSPSAAQSIPNYIRGTVEDSGGSVNGATVVAVPHDQSLDPLVTTTDSNGGYAFEEGDLHGGDNLYHVIARDGTQSDPRRGQENYPFIEANGGTALPDSVTNRWPIKEGSGSTLEDTVGDSGISLTGDAQWESGTWIDDWLLRFDGVDDYGSSNAGTPSGSMTMAVTIDIQSDRNELQGIHMFGSSVASNNNGRLIRFLDTGTNNINFTVASDQGNAIPVTDAISQGTHRIVGVLDTSSGEIRLAVDGTVVQTSTTSDDFTTTTTNHTIARRADDNSRYYEGGIDEPLLANEAWTSTEIQDDYDRQPWS